MTGNTTTVYYLQSDFNVGYLEASLHPVFPSLSLVPPALAPRVSRVLLVSSVTPTVANEVACTDTNDEQSTRVHRHLRLRARKSRRAGIQGV